ncbi:MAG: hypothetical protein LBU18_07760 [Treponema sp.]|jgi:hypothetical protein|nr:hypothetical protein [Treponema sp.]
MKKILVLPFVVFCLLPGCNTGKEAGINLESAAAKARSASGNGEAAIGDLGPYILAANAGARGAAGDKTLENALNAIAGEYVRRKHFRAGSRA